MLHNLNVMGLTLLIDRKKDEDTNTISIDYVLKNQP